MNEEFHIGDEKVDKEHDDIIEYFKLINQDLEKEDLKITDFKAMLLHIMKHVTEHFYEEEDLMEKVRMPRDAIAFHKEEHSMIRLNLVSIIRNFTIYDRKELIDKIKKIEDDVIHHIKNIDSQITMPH